MKLVKSVSVYVWFLTLACAGCANAPTSPSTNPPPSSTNPATSLASVLSIRITPDDGRVNVGQTFPFSVAVELGEGVPPSGPLPRWSVTNPAVLSVDGNGNVTGLAPGEAVLSVEFRGKTATRQVEVVR